MSKSRKVLFVCVENAGRARMAEAFARLFGLEAMSADTMPAKYVKPLVIQVMQEVNIYVRTRRPKLMDSRMVDWADLVVTMGCSLEEACPAPLVAKMDKKLIQ